LGKVLLKLYADLFIVVTEFDLKKSFLPILQIKHLKLSLEKLLKIQLSYLRSQSIFFL